MRVVLTGCVLAALMVGGAATASAQPSPSPPPSGSVTITLTPEQVAFLCDKRLPRISNRVTKLIERINGGADVRGSVAWLKEKARQERDAGRETSAQLLEEKAERRAGRIDELNKINGWVSEFRSAHCGAK
ncbi:MAG TPA: hypothetical protein VGX25_03350 [Actinophytocola sp.]|uniref:hypothetical protein n=1 Tax=Actinophytocola sp. TaxID=1872138 RepID=UPI002DDD29A0|nr:hypothetical protein [Actinophytocola sp.]HEV2778415.1 hypothetical protein [Actinophytocola sp.]